MPQPEYVLRSYGGGAAVAQLAQQMGSSDVTFTVTPTTGWTENGTSNPLGTVGPFTVVIDDGTPSRESILCQSIDLTSGLVSVYVDPTDGWSGRGYDSTSAVAHVPGGTSSGVMPAWSSLEAAEANQAVFDLLGAGGISSLGVPIGTSIDYRGMPNAVPTNFMFEDGTAISRTTYSACLTEITMAFTGTTSAAGATITAVGTTTVNGSTVNITSLLPVGGKLQLVNSGGAVYTIQSVTTNTIVLTSGVGVTAGTAGGITFFPHGAGDGSTTFNIPDSRGRTTMGQGQVNTQAQPNLYVGQVGGLSTVTLTVAQIPAGLTVTDSGHVHVTNAAAGSPPTSYQTLYTDPLPSSDRLGLATDLVNGPYVTFNGSNTTINATTGVVVGGGGGSHENKSPYSVATKIIRVQ